MSLTEKVPAEGYPAQGKEIPQGVKSVYIPEKIIQDKVKQMAEAAAVSLPQRIHSLIILKGASVFAADFFRELARIRAFEIYHSFLKVSSYGKNAESSGEVVLSHDIHEVRDRTILVIEDIIDTGRTLVRLRDYLIRERGAQQVSFCCLLDKKSARLPYVKLVPDFCGFEVENLFLVGYGLDYAEKFRELPYIGVLDRTAFGV